MPEGPMSNREIQEQASILRKFIGPAGHHPNCDSRDGKECDCYAKPRIRALDALEELLAEIYRRVPA